VLLKEFGITAEKTSKKTKKLPKKPNLLVFSNFKRGF
jgi:hypothetical protein